MHGWQTERSHRTKIIKVFGKETTSQKGLGLLLSGTPSTFHVVISFIVTPVCHGMWLHSASVWDKTALTHHTCAHIVFLLSWKLQFPALTLKLPLSWINICVFMRMNLGPLHRVRRKKKANLVAAQFNYTHSQPSAEELRHTVEPAKQRSTLLIHSLRPPLLCQSRDPNWQTFLRLPSLY